MAFFQSKRHKVIVTTSFLTFIDVLDGKGGS